MIFVSPFQLKNPLICGNSCENSLVNCWDGYPVVSCTSLCDSCIIHRFTCCPKISISQVSFIPASAANRFVEFLLRKSHRACKWLEPVKSFWSSHSKTLVSMAWWSRGCVGWILFFSDGWKDYWTHIFFTWPFIRVFFFSGVRHFVVTFLEVGLLKTLFKIDILRKVSVLTRESRVKIISWKVVAAKNGAWVDKYIRNIIQQLQKHPKTGELPGWPHCWCFRNPQMFHLLSMFHPGMQKMGDIGILLVTGAAAVHLYKPSTPTSLWTAAFFKARRFGSSTHRKVWLPGRTCNMPGFVQWKTLGFSLKEALHIPHGRSMGLV